MAGLSTRKNGSRFVTFYRNGKREMIYLGQIESRKANTVVGHVEELISAAAGNVTIRPATASWLKDIDDELADKLAAVGLIEPRQPPAIATLDAFLANYVDSLNVKDGTRFNLDLARRNLVEFFGTEKPIAAITKGDAKDWRRWLERQFSANTVKRRCGRAKQFFQAAVDKELIAKSPFAKMPDCRVGSNKSRDYFLTMENARKVLAACPNAQWAVLFALSRFGGLRCPSEHALLRVDEVDFKAGKFKVYSPKTEHHDGKESRVVPIFPELRPYLEKAIAELPPGEEYLITLPGVVCTRGTNKSAKIRTMIGKIVKRAGLKPWPKLFHNLRASRQTELTDQFPEHVVCDWIGNTRAIAREHYLRVKDEHFEAAIGSAADASQKSDAESDVEELTQNTTCHKTPQDATLGNVVQKCLEAKGLSGVFPVIREILESYLVTPTGLEPVLPP